VPDTATSTGYVFELPSLGADMETGTVLQWYVGIGDTVTRGDVVALVSTEKADIDVEIFHGGVIDALLIDRGEQVPVGTPIARVRAAGEPSSPPPGPGPVHAAAPSPAPAPAPAPQALEVPTGPLPTVTSPLVRHLADELHVDLRAVHGSEAGGRIGRDDVVASAPTSAPRPRMSPRARRLAQERGIPLDRLPTGRPIRGDDVLALAGTPMPPLAASASWSPPAPPSPPASEPPQDETERRRRNEQRVRNAIAALMSRSWAEIPHFHVTGQLDVSAALRELTEINSRRPVADRVLPAAVLLHAVAAAAAKVPAINGWWVDGRFEPASRVDLGVVQGKAAEDVRPALRVLDAQRLARRVTAG